MNQIKTIRTNEFFAKQPGSDEIVKIHEIILLVDKPVYKQTNEGEVIRERGLEEFRFCATEKGLTQVVEYLQTLIEEPKG